MEVNFIIKFCLLNRYEKIFFNMYLCSFKFTFLAFIKQLSTVENLVHINSMEYDPKFSIFLIECHFDCENGGLECKF
ncbi:hypothetical protein BpHYR1_053229 [Brachionus plicatilis]|uniref:Uncharacterized protein n=1 Tax=Brachionus plicatilis TaxID=10195 RepID=A0A3M7SHS1_BRAPC|nr:hypothetical protein BpHYR1_053229 [Brachionus plicatilis]